MSVDLSNTDNYGPLLHIELPLPVKFETVFLENFDDRRTPAQCVSGARSTVWVNPGGGTARRARAQGISIVDSSSSSRRSRVGRDLGTVILYSTSVHCVAMTVAGDRAGQECIDRIDLVLAADSLTWIMLSLLKLLPDRLFYS
eukprot:COSAG02_NODE_1739_length_11117_cov_14.095843_8_plen_143_part_00